MIKLGVRCLESAAKMHAGTAEGAFCQGVLERRKGDLGAARKSLEESVRLKPDFEDAWFQLASLYARLGLPDKVVEARATANNLVQTTAAPYLVQSWGQIASTRWKSAKETLHHATELDAADARIPAYLAVIAQAQDKPAEAVAYFRAALALEEARARLSGTTFLANGTGVRSTSEFGLSLACRQLLGELLLKEKQPEAALELFRANEKVGKRVPAQDWGIDVPTAMLPEPNLEPGMVPEARILAAYLLWSQLYAGGPTRTSARRGSRPGMASHRGPRGKPGFAGYEPGSQVDR